MIQMVLASIAVGTTERGGAEGAGENRRRERGACSSSVRRLLESLLTGFRGSPRDSVRGRAIANAVPGTDNDTVLGAAHQVPHRPLPHPAPIHLLASP